MTPILVLDSNVYISAVLFGGKPRQIIEAALAGRIRLAVSASILEEIEGVLSGKKFKFPETAAREIVSEISILAEIFEAVEKVSQIKNDPDDNRILECALAASAAAIVSGDSHLLALGSFRGIPILSPGKCLEKYKVG
ncbi:MAG: putative toxin-antitoxin system toxin component, PIN family [Candidatus Aminicenantes bacterium]|nr:putative toxin-antitoxin system toxin component, PIN family [Candidatus Aminicenantes bacterium]